MLRSSFGAKTRFPTCQITWELMAGSVDILQPVLRMRPITLFSQGSCPLRHLPVAILVCMLHDLVEVKRSTTGRLCFQNPPFLNRSRQSATKRSVSEARDSLTRTTHWGKFFRGCSTKRIGVPSWELSIAHLRQIRSSWHSLA